MPLLTRLFIRTSLLYLVAALVVGVASALPAAGSSGLAYAVRPVYLHLFMAGWIGQLIFGVAFWMFPRYSKERPYGRERAVWAAYGLLNAGLLLRAIAEPLHATGPAPGWGGLLAASAVLQALAALCFTAGIWERVKGK